MGAEALIEELVAEINRLKKIIPNVYDDELYDAAKKIVAIHPGAEIKVEDNSGARGTKVTLKFLSIEKPNFN